jgi:hypothetical protein
MLLGSLAQYFLKLAAGDKCRIDICSTFSDMGPVVNSPATSSLQTLPIEIILAIGEQCTPFDRLKLRQAGVLVSLYGLQHSLVCPLTHTRDPTTVPPPEGASSSLPF